MVVINLFGGPCSGKSTCAAYVFSKLKMLGINTELVTEYAKDLVWENNNEVLNNQLLILGNQFNRIKRLNNKVDFVVCDSPILNSIVYSTDLPPYDKYFKEFVYHVHECFNSLNYFINRNELNFSDIGRVHNLDVSKMLDEKIKKVLEDYNVTYNKIEQNIKGYDKIVDDVLLCDNKVIKLYNNNM